jgi:preprotein translocase subunit SecF
LERRRLVPHRLDHLVRDHHRSGALDDRLQPGRGHRHAAALGLSFTGGTDVTVKFKRPSTRCGRAALATSTSPTRRSTRSSKAGEPAGERYTIETQTDFGDRPPKLWSALGTAARRSTARSRRSPPSDRRSHEYLINALEALVIAIAIQFLYIAFRFGWNYIFGLVTSSRSCATRR